MRLLTSGSVGCALFLGCSLLGEPVSGGTGDDREAARAVVADLQQNLLAAMIAGEEWDYSRRFRELEPAVKRTHHFPVIARVVLGKHWLAASDEDKRRFLVVFENFAVASMASNFDRHKGEQFEIEETTDPQRGQIRVRTKMTRSGRPDIRFDYILMNSAGDWAIINVIVDGVSDVALKRADYRQLLEAGGLSALIVELQAKVDATGGVPQVPGEPAG